MDIEQSGSDNPIYPADHLLAMLVGNVRALHKAVNLLIATHPTPKTALETWRANFAEQIDSEMASPMFGSNQFRKGFQAAMAQLTEAFESAGGS